NTGSVVFLDIAGPFEQTKNLAMIGRINADAVILDPNPHAIFTRFGADVNARGRAWHDKFGGVTDEIGKALTQQGRSSQDGQQIGRDLELKRGSLNRVHDGEHFLEQGVDGDRFELDLFTTDTRVTEKIVGESIQ